ncbi:DUF3244 domain-containing protein [Anaerocellum danielii]|uniref:Uncharacterized protein n=1 Tax=Anaerocellum danielii TaxID=1387557 RepID=A0ABZ0U315_9FIRM|nr:hypothetical protein [Caldicellulosiruptor danielii]WPX09661.1 hypothetical protein SOJ16_000894 [Caldicellulosiruptor danielii]
MKTKFLLKVILICFLFFGVLLFINSGNFNQFKSDKVSYNTSIKKIGTKEYITDIKFNYVVEYGKEETFVIYVDKSSLVLNCQHMKCTNKITIKIKDKRDRIIYKEDIGEKKDERFEVNNLKNGEYELILFFKKGVGEGYIKIE